MKTEVESIVEGILKLDDDLIEFAKQQKNELVALKSRIKNLTLEEKKELSNKLFEINNNPSYFNSDYVSSARDMQDIVDNEIAKDINGKMGMAELTEKLVALSFESSNAYTKAVKEEDPFERRERIAKAIQEVQQKEAMAYEKLLENPRPLK